MIRPKPSNDVQFLSHNKNIDEGYSQAKSNHGSNRVESVVKQGQ